MKRVILLILALVLTLSLMACRSKEPEDAADAADNNTLSNSAPLTFAEASTLEYDNGQVTCRFRKDEDGWKWVDNESFPLDVSYVEEILTALDTMSVTLTPVTPAVEPADSGLDEPDRYMTVTVGEEITTLCFGDQKDDGQWYMAIDGQEDTYLAADEFVKLMDRSIYDMAVLPTLPELTEGQSFRVTSTVSEHFTSPPKAYTEDTLLSAMERAGAEDMPENAERKGLGTPATRAAILEKLVQMGFVQRKGKQLVPTKDGINLAVVLPESLTSPALTAEWENRLTEIAKGNADPDEFMAEIEAQVRQLVKTYSCISADKQNLFQSERVIIGKCPRCSENVYEGKKNFYCGNRSCQFVMWKNDRFFEQRKKAFTPKIAAALLKNGKAKVKGLYSEKTGKTYDATVLLADTGGKYVNYRVERKE